MVIVIGLENPTFLVKSDIFIAKCTEGGGGGGLEIFLKNTNFFSQDMQNPSLRMSNCFTPPLKSLLNLESLA